MIWVVFKVWFYFSPLLLRLSNSNGFLSCHSLQRNYKHKSNIFKLWDHESDQPGPCMEYLGVVTHLKKLPNVLEIFFFPRYKYMLQHYCKWAVRGFLNIFKMNSKSKNFHSGISHSFPGGSDGKEPGCQRGRPGFDPWVRKDPCRRAWQPTPVFLPGEFYGKRSLAGYSPWGHKESDRSEQLTLSLSYLIQNKLFQSELRSYQSSLHFKPRTFLSLQKSSI